MMLYRFEVDYTVPGKMGSKNYVTAVAATDAAHARVEAGKIFEGLKEDYGYDKALGKLYSASGICKCIAEFNEPVALTKRLWKHSLTAMDIHFRHGR